MQSINFFLAADEDDVDIEYDADGNPIAPVKSKYIDPLPPIDHSKIDYKPFEKNFYNEHPDIAGLSPIQVNFLSLIITFFKHLTNARVEAISLTRVLEGSELIPNCSQS